MRSTELIIILATVLIVGVIASLMVLKHTQSITSTKIPSVTKEKPDVLIIVHPTETYHIDLVRSLSIHANVYTTTLGTYTVRDLTKYDVVIVGSKVLTPKDIEVLSTYTLAGGKLVYSVLYCSPDGYTVSTSNTLGDPCPPTRRRGTLHAGSFVILSPETFCGVLCKGIKRDSMYKVSTDVQYAKSISGYLRILSEDHNLITQYFELRKRVLIFYVDYLELYKYKDLKVDTILLNFIFNV